MIKFESVSKTFRWKKDEVAALKDINLTIEDGEIYGIIGFSGAGKSTLVRMVNGLEKPTAGTVLVDGKDLSQLKKSELRSLRKTIGMVFQQFNLLESKTVYQNVAMPLVLNKVPKEEIQSRVKELLAFVELDDKADAFPSQLSGGQKQRVGIARALATNPGLLLCDEATSALDPKTTDSILDLLKKINKDLGITIIIITHEMHVIQKVCDKVAVMENGVVIESGTVQEVFSSPRDGITKGFVGMIVKEDIPEELVCKLQQEKKLSQVWNIKYWGENQTISIVEDLKNKTGNEVNILYTTTSVLQDQFLNVLVVDIPDKEDKTKEVKEALASYGALSERKEYEY